MKYKDLEVGMVVSGTRSSGDLITRLGTENSFFEGKDNITFLDVNDSYHGQASRQVHEDEEFALLEGDERKEVLKIIFEHLLDSQSHIDDCVSMVRIALHGGK